MSNYGRGEVHTRRKRLVAAPLVAVASLAVSFVAVVGFSTAASAQEIDIDFCTNFYPELCVGPDGEIDKSLFPFLIDGAPIPGYTDPRYDTAVLALARHRAGDDTDGNGVPDSPEIAVCGEPGCLPDAMAESEVTEPELLTMTMCKEDPEGASSVVVDISEGMNPDKLVSVFTLSSPIVNYVGSYPEGGKVRVTAGPTGPSFGVHRVVAVGTADGLNEAETKVWRMDVVERTTGCDKPASNTTGGSTTGGSRVQGTTQTQGRGSTGAATARTGVNVGLLVMAGTAAVLVGSALLVSLRRRSAASSSQA